MKFIDLLHACTKKSGGLDVLAIQVFEDSGEVMVWFLHPHGPSSSFKYPAREKNVKVNLENK